MSSMSSMSSNSCHSSNSNYSSIYSSIYSSYSNNISYSSIRNSSHRLGRFCRCSRCHKGMACGRICGHRLGNVSADIVGQRRIRDSANFANTVHPSQQTNTCGRGQARGRKGGNEPPIAPANLSARLTT